MDFCHLEEIYLANMENNYCMLLKVAHKAAEATGAFTGNKIADKIVRPKSMLDMNSRNVEEIINLPEKREEILNEHYKISKLLNDLTVSTFVTRKWIKIIDLSDDQYSSNKTIRCDYRDAYIVVK